MKKNWIYTTLIILILTISGCASDPETPEETPEETTVEETVTPEEPAEEPVEEEPVEPEVVVEPVSTEELKVAEEAVDRAALAGAEHYSPELFLAANEDLEEALNLKESDPDSSRELITSSVEKANAAYDDSVDKQVDEKVAKLRILESQLNEIEADKFSPADFAIVKERADRLIEYLNNEDYENADKQYKSTLRAMQNLHDTIDNNIRWIKILDRDSSTYMSDAEEQEAYLWAPEELEKANYSYSEGISHFNNYNLDASEKALKEAKYWAFHAIRLSERRKRQSQTDSLMMEAMEELEKASRNRVMDNQGNVTEADPWDGDDYIEENPVTGDDTEDFEDEDSSLKEYDPDAEVKGDENAMILPGTTVVLGDEQQMTLLEQAIELWKQGVKARSEGKYDIADEYFKQSKAYSEAYSANAVALEYTVKRRDTLWGIAGKKDILDNPFLWTKIWRRNSLIIDNPDLIYPGQTLIIPPKD